MSTLTTAELDARVAQGASLLDDKCPGWPGDVDLDALDTFDTQFCVAAQVVCYSADGDAYEEAMDKLNLDVVSRIAHGFSLTGAEAGAFAREAGTTERTATYAPLTDAWKRLIAARLDGAA